MSGAVVTTPELKVGDVVLHYGARVRLVRELVRRPCCEQDGHCRPEQGHGELVCILGVVENAADPDVDSDFLSLARGERPHRERNGRWCPTGDKPLWTVQGNALAQWRVETGD
jgi:hypothetical protein